MPLLQAPREQPRRISAAVKLSADQTQYLQVGDHFEYDVIYRPPGQENNGIEFVNPSAAVNDIQANKALRAGHIRLPAGRVYQLTQRGVGAGAASGFVCFVKPVGSHMLGDNIGSYVANDNSNQIVPNVGQWFLHPNAASNTFVIQLVTGTATNLISLRTDSWLWIEEM